MKLEEVFSRTIEILSKNPYILVMYMFPAILALIMGIMQFAYQASIQERLQREIMQNPRKAFDIMKEIFLGSSLLLGTCCLGVIQGLLAIVVASVAIAMTVEEFRDRSISIGGALRKASSKLIICIVLSIIVAIAYIILGVLTCCLGFLFLAPFVVFLLPAIIIEDLGFEAIGKSISFGKKNYVDVLLIFFMIAVVGMVAYTILYKMTQKEETLQEQVA